MAVSLLDLWLPILLSSIGVFIVSSLLHMLLQWHKGDYGSMPAEPQVLESLRVGGVNPGQYMFPCPSSMKEMASPEMVAKYEQGPVGYLIVMPTGVPTIGKSLLQWFGLSVLIAILAAYAATIALDRGAAYMDVFRLTSTVAIAGHGLGALCDSIWKGIRWSTSLKYVVDAILYALVLGGVFGSMWPAA